MMGSWLHFKLDTVLQNLAGDIIILKHQSKSYITESAHFEKKKKKKEATVQIPDTISALWPNDCRHD